MVDLSRARTIVLVFHQDGCPACSEFMPRFNAAAKQLQGCLPVVRVDIAKPEAQGLADKFKVKFTPTTVVWQRPSRGRSEGWKTWESAVSDQEIEMAFAIAARSASCPVDD